jgi:hypothetical protein
MARLDINIPAVQRAEREYRTTASAVAATMAAKPEKPPERITEQNFLLRNLDLLASARAKIPVKRVVRMKTKDPGALLSRLNLRPNVEELFKIRPHQVGALVPKIRLYKVFLDDTAVPGKVVELKFNDHTTSKSIEDITSTAYGRGDGVGIQSFTIETQGTNPAEGALVRCTLKIFFQNLELLASPSGDRKTDYLELILRRTRWKKEENSSAQAIPHARIANKDYFKLMAEVGWAVPEETHGTIGTPLRKALEKCSQTIFLSLLEHNIEFNQDGTAVLTAEYQGALEQMMSSDSYDILSLGEKHDLSGKLREEQKKLDDKRKEGKDIKDDPRSDENDANLKQIGKEIVALKKQINELTANARAEKYKRLIETLYNSGKIGSVDITPEQWEKIHQGGRGDLRAIVASDITVNDPRSDAAKEFKERIKPFTGDDTSTTDKVLSFFSNALSSKADTSTRISFFYFGDLMDLAAQIIDDRREKDKNTTPDIKVLLGPVTFNVVNDDGTVTPKQVNLANVPICLKSFEFWFNKNVVKRKINTWPLRAFIKQAVSELILNALGENSKQDEGIRRSNQIGIQNLLIPGLGTDRKKHRIKGNANGDFDLDNPSSSGVTAYNSFPINSPSQIGYNGYKHYLLVYGSTEILDRRNPADVGTDFKKGIYHFNIGADAGLVKSINFTKTDVPGLKESRLTSQDEEEGQLRDKYNASLELLGSSPLFTPGQKVYVNPTLAGLGTLTSKHSIARQLGLGGYYDVTKVLSTIDKSGYRTSLECVWTSFGMETGAKNTRTAQAAAAENASSGEAPAAKSISEPVDPKVDSAESPPPKKKSVPPPNKAIQETTARMSTGIEKDKIAKQKSLSKAPTTTGDPEGVPPPVKDYASPEETRVATAAAMAPRPAASNERAAFITKLQAEADRAQEAYLKEVADVRARSGPMSISEDEHVDKKHRAYLEAQNRVKDYTSKTSGGRGKPLSVKLRADGNVDFIEGG